MLILCISTRAYTQWWRW